MFFHDINIKSTGNFRGFQLRNFLGSSRKCYEILFRRELAGRALLRGTLADFVTFRNISKHFVIFRNNSRKFVTFRNIHGKVGNFSFHNHAGSHPTDYYSQRTSQNNPCGRN